jgi:hypothetical protein
MGVGQPFNQQFKAGDVLYGVSWARIPYINSLPVGVADHLRGVGQYVICDEYNNRTFASAHQVVAPGPAGVGPGSQAAIAHNLQRNAIATNLTPLQQAALSEYYDALAGTRYAPIAAVQVPASILVAKGNQNAEDLAFRRACKFGLQFVIEQKQRTVHFVLDMPAYMGVPGNRQDSADIVNKTQHAGHVPITTSELRCCYRNRAHWIPLGRLKFYFNLLEVNPPWVDDPATWAVYEAHRKAKGVI